MASMKEAFFSVLPAVMSMENGDHTHTLHTWAKNTWRFSDMSNRTFFEAFEDIFNEQDEIEADLWEIEQRARNLPPEDIEQVIKFLTELQKEIS